MKRKKTNIRTYNCIQLHRIADILKISVIFFTLKKGKNKIFYHIICRFYERGLHCEISYS